MARFLIKTAIGVVVAMLVYAVSIAVLSVFIPRGIPNLPFHKGGYGHLFSRVNEAPVYGDVDVVVLGSSRAYRGFDPRIFNERGIRLFNLGSSAQTPLQSLCIARQYIDALNPKLVLIEVYPRGLASDGVESAIDFIANNHIDQNVIKMASKIKHIKVINVLIAGITRQWLGLDKGFTEPKHRAKDTYVSGGYVEKDMSFNEKLTAPLKKRVDLKPLQVKSLEDLAGFLESRGIRVVLVEAPCASVRYQATANRDELIALHSSLADYIDFNGRIELNDSLHFYDQSHLNQEGVALFNNALIDWLETNEYLSDK